MEVMELTVTVGQTIINTEKISVSMISPQNAYMSLDVYRTGATIYRRMQCMDLPAEDGAESGSDVSEQTGRERNTVGRLDGVERATVNKKR